MAYGPPPGYGPPPPNQWGHYAPSPHQPQLLLTAKSPSTAVLLEVLPGLFFQTFGIGNMYAGNTGLGLGLMFGYWCLAGINFALCFVFIGFVTWPLCWIGMMILAPILASNAAKAANARMAAGMAQQ